MASSIQNTPARNAQRLVDISKRFTDPDTTPAAAPTPQPRTDIISELQMTRNIYLDSGNDHTIDVQPDYRIIFRTLTYYVIRTFPEFDIRPHPAVTPMTIMAYFLFCIYGYALACDSHARRLKSYYCNEFHQSENAREILQSILNMHVPSFLTDIIVALSPTTDPRRPGFEFVNTLGAFNLQHDIFRIPTPAMFLHAHTILASTRSSIDPHFILNQWYNTAFFTHTGNGTKVFKLANFFGTNYEKEGAMHTHPNWLNQCVETLFNPVVSRALSARPTYRPIPVFFTSASSYDINPYHYTLLTDSTNIHNTVRFIDEISRFFESSNITTFQLGQVFSKTTGISILTHYCTEPALPTWHTLTVKSTGDTAPTYDTDTAYAKSCSFLVKPAYKAGSKLTIPTDISTINTFLYLVRKGKHDSSSEPEKWIIFDPAVHSYPTSRFFDPYDYSPSKLGYTVITGLTIETFEIDGFTVPTPNLRSSLNDENDQFLQSAVPLRCIKAAANGPQTIVARRSVTHARNQKVSISLWNFAKTRLPFFDEDVKESTLPTSLPGFQAQEHIRSFDRSSNHWSFKHESTFAAPYTLHAWSSYRYVKKQSPSITTDIYFILSFRPFYGTNVTLAESRHPSALIPN